MASLLMLSAGLQYSVCVCVCYRANCYIEHFKSNTALRFQSAGKSINFIVLRRGSLVINFQLCSINDIFPIFLPYTLNFQSLFESMIILSPY